MKIKSLKYIGVYLCCNIVISSCKKFVQIPASPTSIPTSAVFADSTDAVAGILGLYIQSFGNQTRGNFFCGAIPLETGLSSDELYPSYQGGEEQQIYTNQILANNGINSSFWQQGYKLIYDANACIEGVAASNTLSSSLKAELTAEARFFRAYCYFNLCNLYGNIPLITSTDYHSNLSVPRNSLTDIYAQMISDVSYAFNVLPINNQGIGRSRPNKYAAAAFLAKIYLYNKQWDKAEAYAKIVIESNAFSLETDLNNVFLSTSNEAIWQIAPVANGYETTDGVNYVPYDNTSIPTYVINNGLLKSFEPNDMRWSKWTDSTVINGVVYNYPYKYKLGYDGNTTPVEFYVIFRLAEQYLIRAEARAQQGTNNAGAISDINMIRQRAGLPVLSNTLSKGQILTAVARERQIELFTEGANRWFDLKRTAKIDSVMQIVCPQKGGFWNANWQLFPIPLTELQLNNKLIQNPGYH